MAFNEKLGYHDETQALIDRMCRYVERKSFRLNKKAAQEAILKTYDLFDLPRPKSVVWCVDIFDKQFEGSAWSAGSARSARSAWSAGSAWSARSARSAGWTALDDDFWYFVFSYQYQLDPTDSPINEHDEKYLAYSELLLQALEHGAGYRVEWEDTLYIVQTPLVLLDEQNRYHSDVKPAIRWKGGLEFYYLRGENFEKPLWKKITSQTITAEEVMKIGDIDKRTIAISMLAPGEMLKQLNAELIHTGVKGNRLYECKDFMGTSDTEYALVMDDASTPRQFIKFVRPEYVKEKKDADYVTARHYQDAEGNSLPLEDYLLIEQEA